MAEDVDEHLTACVYCGAKYAKDSSLYLNHLEIHIAENKLKKLRGPNGNKIYGNSEKTPT